MELFLNQSHESFVLELLISVLGLDKSKLVKPIKLSSHAVKLYEAGNFKLPGLPCLLTEEENILTTSASISIYLVDLAYCQDILLGGSKEKESEILSVFEFIQRKNKDEVLTKYNEHLLTRSFLFYGHLTLADLALFSYLYPILFVMNDADKLKYNNVLRWYLHIQSLQQIHQTLKADNKGLVELPENLEEDKKKAKK